MTQKAVITVNVDEALSVNKYNVDESSSPIELVANASASEFERLVLLCPAAVYKIDETGAQSFDTAGCLECGTCRIACKAGIITRWENPQPTMGIEYRYG